MKIVSQRLMLIKEPLMMTLATKQNQDFKQILLLLMEILLEENNFFGSEVKHIDSQ